MNQDTIEKLGAPDLKLKGLQIWIHGRQFPDSQDYWDGNWLNITAHCGSISANVFTSGCITALPELAAWREQARMLLKNLKGDANLNCLEPNLSVRLTSDLLGHIDMEVSITPDHLTQRHQFTFQIDQSYLPPLIRQLDKILETYPVR